MTVCFNCEREDRSSYRQYRSPEGTEIALCSSCAGIYTDNYGKFLPLTRQVNQRIGRSPYRYKFELSEREFNLLSQILADVAINSTTDLVEREELIGKILITQPENKVYH